MQLSDVPTTTTGRAAFAATLICATIVGVLAGRLYAYQQSVGGLTAGLGGTALAFGLAGGVVGVAITAAVVAKLRRGSILFSLRLVAVATGLLLLAALVGAITAPATGGT